ncbi:MAG: HEAT repeat domain-containing protein [Candidatus Neomarinimicrobiota bacterium]
MKKLIILFILISIIIGHEHVAQKQAVINQLIEIAMNDSIDSRTRVEALDMLGHSGNEMAVDALLSATFDEDWDVRRQAIISLKFYDFENVHNRLIQLSQDNNPKNKIIAIETMYLAYQEGDLNILVNYLNHQNPKIRLLAAQSFWYITNPEYLDVLKGAYEKETIPEIKRKLRSTIIIREK